MAFARADAMPLHPTGSFSPTDASGAVRSIERLIAQRRFDDAVTLAGRSLVFEPCRRDVTLLQIRALIGGGRTGEAADRALALLRSDPRDATARTLLRTSIGRLHRAVREVLAKTEAHHAARERIGAADDAPTSRHVPFGPPDAPLPLAAPARSPTAATAVAAPQRPRTTPSAPVRPISSIRSALEVAAMAETDRRDTDEATADDEPLFDPYSARRA